jgi:hypothetical protein
VSGDGWDELERRAQESAESGGVPAGWGSKIDLDVGDTFRGRHRGHEEGGKSGGWLAWDADGEPRYIWGCASLDREYDREQPNVGDDVAIVRSENYRTRFDDPDDDPTGLSYGVATRENKSPLPESDSGGVDPDELF